MDKFVSEEEESCIILENTSGKYLPEISCKIKILDFIYNSWYNLSVTIEAAYLTNTSY